jgi:hypothetical protein
MRRVVAGVAAVIALAVPGVAHAAVTGTITGANIDPAGTQVSVSNMSVTFDSCGGSDPSTFGIGGCGVMAGVVPASQTCPAGGIQNLWEDFPGYTFSTGSKTFNSGPRSVAVSSPVAYRICLYSFFQSTNYGRTTPGLRADAITPTPSAGGSGGGTGKRAKALKKCKEKPKGRKRKKCIKKAKKLPV